MTRSNERRTSQLTKTGRSAHREEGQLAEASKALKEIGERTFEVKQPPHALVIQSEDALDDDDARTVEVLRLIGALVGDKRVDGCQ